MTNQIPSLCITETISNCSLHSKPYIYYKTGDDEKTHYCYDCLSSEFVVSNNTNSNHINPQTFITMPNLKRMYLSEIQEIDSLLEKFDLEKQLSKKIQDFSEKLGEFFVHQTKKIISELIINSFQKNITSYINNSNGSINISNVLSFLSKVEDSKFEIKTCEIFAITQLKYLQEKFIKNSEELAQKFVEMNKTFFESRKKEKKEILDDNNNFNFDLELKEIIQTIVPLKNSQSPPPKPKISENLEKENNNLNLKEKSPLLQKTHSPSKKSLSPSYKHKSLLLSSSSSKGEKVLVLNKPNIASFDESNKENCSTNPRTNKKYSYNDPYGVKEDEITEKNRKKINNLISHSYYHSKTNQFHQKHNKISSFTSLINKGYNDELISKHCYNCNKEFRITKAESKWKWRCNECYAEYSMKRYFLKKYSDSKEDNDNDDESSFSIFNDAKNKKINAVCVDCKKIFMVSLLNSKKIKKCEDCTKKEKNEKVLNNFESIEEKAEDLCDNKESQFE